MKTLQVELTMLKQAQKRLLAQGREANAEKLRFELGFGKDREKIEAFKA
jgi:hypothetical protein